MPVEQVDSVSLNSPPVAPFTISRLPPQLTCDVQILHIFILFGKLKEMFVNNDDVAQPTISLYHSATVHFEFIIKLWQ